MPSGRWELLVGPDHVVIANDAHDEKDKVQNQDENQDQHQNQDARSITDFGSPGLQ